MSEFECKKVERLLVHHVLDILDDDSRTGVLAHLGSCTSCIEKFDAVSLDVDTMRRWPEVDAPGDAVAAVLEETARLFPEAKKEKPAEPAPAEPVLSPAQRGEMAALLDDDEEELANLEQSLEDLESLIQSSKGPKEPKGPAIRPRPGGALSEQDRDLIRKELGFDEVFDDDDEPAEETKATGEFDEFEEMARAAEKAAQSKRLRRRTSDDDWKKMAGTTILGPEELAAAAAEAAAETSSTDEWQSKSKTQIIPPASSKDDDESFLGTTILPAVGAAPKNPTKRFSSVVLAQIKTVAPEKRERKKRIKRVARVSPAIVLSVGLHVAAVLVLTVLVWVTVSPRKMPTVQIQNKQDVEEEQDEIEDEVEEKDVEETDNIKDDASEKDESSDQEAEPQAVYQPVAIAAESGDALVRQGSLGDRRRGGAGGGGRGGTFVAVDRALEWFRVHQDDDGKWDWVGYTAHCAKHGGGVCEHCVKAMYAKEGRKLTPGLTGLILLSYLGSAFTHTDLDPTENVSDRYRKRHALYRDTVKRAIRYLVRIQSSDGCFGPKKDTDLEGYMYNHGICSLALAEAYHLSKDEKLKKPCERALVFIKGAQNPRSGGWDYVAYRSLDPRHDRSDTSVSSWQVMAMKAAHDAGLKVDSECWKRAGKFFRRVMYRSRGRFRYAHGKQADQRHSNRNSGAVNAASLLSLLYLGEPITSRVMSDGAMELLRDLPSPLRVSEKPYGGAEFNYHSVYYWYYGTLVMFNMGGEYWTSWKESLVKMLKTTQEQEPPLKGTWTPLGDFLGFYGGRLYVTAFNVLNLEVNYRYLPMYKYQKKEKPAAGAAVEKKLRPKDALLKDASNSRLAKRKRRKAIEQLGLRFGRNPQTLKVLASCLMDPNLSWNAKRSAFMTLKRAGDPALPHLRRLVFQLGDDWKQLIIVVLRDRKDPRAVPIFRELVKTSRSKAVKAEAEQALKTLSR